MWMLFDLVVGRHENTYTEKILVNTANVKGFRKDATKGPNGEPCSCIHDDCLQHSWTVLGSPEEILTKINDRLNAALQKGWYT